MTFRGALGWLVLLLAGCGSQLGRVRVSVVFENETRTQCIKASARTASGAQVTGTPSAIPRAGRDTLLIGVGETSELKGEVKVTISRFTSADCTGTAFASETKTAEIVHGAATAVLEFRFSDDGGDGGVDAGTDAGTGEIDAGCDLAACGNVPGECEVARATGCQSDGGCRFGFRPAQTTCSAGVCNSMGTCIADVCSVLPAGSACDDGLTCTATSACSSGVCRGTCATPPACNLPVQPLTCDLTTPTACALRPTTDLSSCNSSGGQCLAGACLPWLQYPPINFPSTLDTVPYPTGRWTIASPDGGFCDTIISTTGAMATVVQADCGAPNIITSTVNDAGVSVITMTGLDVGARATLQFVGTRPVQLVVLGNATISGIVSVAPLRGGQQPAGTQPGACSAAQSGASNDQGGGGGAFGGSGGKGGDLGGLGGTATSVVSPLRGGCAGGSGYRSSGNSAGGTGGGAIQLIVADTLTLSGIVTASGGGGAAGTADHHGGGGGGSGGAVILEARTINLTGGAVTANGGGGGQGGDNGQTSDPGALGPLQSALAALPADHAGSLGGIGGVGGVDSQANGGPGGDASGSQGGGGGGGSVGVVFLHGVMSCTRGTGVISGAQPKPFTCI